tara:strand:+ start:6719 stop:6934 length:216 start_codon:yes stop_codon:yes gene_type:complete
MRQLVEASRRLLKYVRVTNNGMIPIDIWNDAKVIFDYATEAELEDSYWDIQMAEAEKYEEDRMRIEMGDNL